MLNLLKGIMIELGTGNESHIHGEPKSTDTF